MKRDRQKLLQALRAEIRDFFYRQSGEVPLGPDAKLLWEAKPIDELTDVELEGALLASRAVNEAHDKHQLRMAEFEEKCLEARIKRAGFLSILTGTWK